MSKIKTKESVKDIKVLDKAAVASERMKTALIRSKDQMQNLMDDGQVSPSEYAEDKLRYAAEDVADFLMRKDEVEKQIECLRQEIQELTPIDTRQKKENLVERLEALKQKLSEYTDFENTLIIPDGVIEAFTEQIIASDKGFDWYLKAVPDMVKSFMDDTPDDETEKEWHELTQFDLTIEDAKAYVYSFSSRRRVHGWQNIKIRLFV